MIRDASSVKLALAAFIALALACSSNVTPTVQGRGDSGAVDAALSEREASVAETGASVCKNDTERVSEDGTCCGNLFRVCPNVSFGGMKLCICSSVECGTAEMQPPFNVPCCPSAMSSSCVVSFSPEGTQCTCM
jgi:hypothetical protein